jgi:hypothetical protein
LRALIITNIPAWTQERLTSGHPVGYGDLSFRKVHRLVDGLSKRAADPAAQVVFLLPFYAKSRKKTASTF